MLLGPMQSPHLGSLGASLVTEAKATSLYWQRVGRDSQTHQHADISLALKQRVYEVEAPENVVGWHGHCVLVTLLSRP